MRLRVDEGKLLAGRYSFCNLNTDLSNPVSNRIYQKIGYVPLGDTLEFDFEYTSRLDD